VRPVLGKLGGLGYFLALARAFTIARSVSRATTATTWPRA
jgi:hypothetical protein